MKPEIIILTGTDCTGKTTIKKEIEKQVIIDMLLLIDSLTALFMMNYTTGQIGQKCFLN